MRALAPTLLLLATAAAGEAPAGAPPPASAAATPAAPAAAPAKPGPAPVPPVVPTPALIEKLGQGDRLFLAADYRNALFAYQDAVYMQPGYAPARVKLGRAYLALRHAPQAIAQAEAALAADPDSAEARKLLDDARSAPARPAAASAGAVPQAAPAKGPRVFRFKPEPDAAPPGDAATAESRVLASVEAPVNEVAAQHYRAGVAQLESREWAKALAELSAAIASDPKLAVAHTARGSAYFGLGKYRDAAADYDEALVLDSALGTPLYGLAECYRMLGDAKRAAEMYERYATSRASDVRDDLRAVAVKRARDLR